MIKTKNGFKKCWEDKKISSRSALIWPFAKGAMEHLKCANPNRYLVSVKYTIFKDVLWKRGRVVQPVSILIKYWNGKFLDTLG